jgi:pyruvate/2-oxoglutarate dehydrogenase complex dihydrolipoamide acyltransferase (E2) component
MSIKVLVPRLGEGVEELTIVKWLKKEGEPVREMESLLEVETDKVITEIPSPADGVVLKITKQESTLVKVGEIMAWIGQAGEQVPDEGSVTKVSLASPEKPFPGVKDGIISSTFESSASSQSNNEPGFLSPVVRKIAAEKNLDLRQIKGTGLGGRITKQDVLNSLMQPTSKLSVSVSKQDPGLGAGKTIPLTTMRRQIAERMQISQQTSPHVLTVMEVDMQKVSAHREMNKAGFAADGIHLTFTAYFMVAIAAGLKAHPLVNSSWSENGIILHDEINIGMATSLGEQGLIVPVVQQAEQYSLLGMARVVNDLSRRARERKLLPEEVRGGTFTLTNHGIGGSLLAMPIINQPQCGILGAGAIQKRAVVSTDTDGSDSISIRPMVYLSFVFDHRILDGASGDAFLATVCETLQKWH